MTSLATGVLGVRAKKYEKKESFGMWMMLGGFVFGELPSATLRIISSKFRICSVFH